VVVDPADYSVVAEQISQSGTTTLELRRRLAAKVFTRTAAYDAAIAAHLEQAFSGNQDSAMPSSLRLHVPLVQKLRYGENPHQAAALYGNFGEYFEQLHGKELSYNNILDLTAAANLISEFSEADSTLAILKHTNPCGVGQAENLKQAWEKAFATDRQAPFGGIISVNQPLDKDCAESIAEIFSEVIVAPNFSEEALQILQKKKNLRLLKMLKPAIQEKSFEIRSVASGLLLAQQPDATREPDAAKIVTKRQPTQAERAAMLFGWRIAKHVKSNAIVFAAADRTLGIGAGQMSRVDASRIAVWKAGEAGLSLTGSAVCSDAFFPFPDGLIAASEAGATAAIQPGGSMRDAEVIAAADERNMAMMFTGVRHFRH